MSGLIKVRVILAAPVALLIGALFGMAWGFFEGVEMALNRLSSALREDLHD